MLPVVELVVVGARIAVLVPAKGILGIVKLEKRTNLLVDVRLHQRRKKTAIVLLIVNEQGGARRPHRDQERVIEVAQQISGSLFYLLRIGGSRQVSFHRSDTRDLDHCSYPLI